MRNFFNPQTLPQLIISRRIRSLDPFAIATDRLVTDEGPEKNVVEIESTLSDTDIENALAPALTAAEQQYLGAFSQATSGFDSLPGWSSWTIAEFNTWCDANLMTDAQIDASAGLSAALKTNLKANNAFTRNGGKAIIYLRNYVMNLRR